MRKIILLSAIFCLFSSPVFAWVDLSDKNWSDVNKYLDEYIELKKNEDYDSKQAFGLLQQAMGVLSYADIDLKTRFLFGGYIRYLMAGECKRVGYSNDVFLDAARDTKIINRKNKLKKRELKFLIESLQTPGPNIYDYEIIQEKRIDLVKQPSLILVKNEMNGLK